MNKYNRLLTGIIITCLVSTSGFFYSKNVQAAKLENDLQTALESDNYENAKSIHKKVSEDIVIYKLFSFNDKAGNLAKERYEAIKTSYLTDSITYNEFNSKIEELKKLSYFYEDESQRQSIEKIEDLREAYRRAEELMSEKDYTDAMGALKEIENDIDAVYKTKVSTLKINITDSALKETEASIADFISKRAYSEAFDLLDKNKDLLSNDYYNEKTNKLNELFGDKKKQFELKKLQLEEKMKKEDPKLAAYLVDYVPNPEKENAVSSVSSKSKFLVWVDLSNQTTNVFIGSKNSWKLIRSFVSSTGTPGDETPAGTYVIKDRGKWFFSEKYQEGAKYWVRFIGNYLFHSLPMDENQQVVDPTLGTPASHGCVRLGIDNAAWFYNNIPTGTTVYIK